MGVDMPDASMTTPDWIDAWMISNKISLWGAADLHRFETPRDESGQRFASALSFAIPMNPQIMVAIQDGPTAVYADEYYRINQKINKLSADLAAEIQRREFRAKPLAASDRTDTVTIKGDFPHKTAATRAGLGWIGRHCQLITRPFGSWVRLGTVFCDMPMACGPAIRKSFCGRCTRCVDACPANALKGSAWHPGINRNAILDAVACDRWKKENYFQYHKGHVCGICSAVCPYGMKQVKRLKAKG
jgi:epoxyqueuosine reductase QueG